MSKIRNKMKKQGGFTLIEMLVVVALIAILIAVSIPTVKNALDKAKRATDAANERSAKAEATVQYLTEGIANGSDWGYPKVMYYYAYDGTLSDDRPTEKKDMYGQCKLHKNGYIQVSIDEDGDVTLIWANAPSGGRGTLDSREIIS